jgi:hypothetical protein
MKKLPVRQNSKRGRSKFFQDNLLDPIKNKLKNPLIIKMDL